MKLKYLYLFFRERKRLLFCPIFNIFYIFLAIFFLNFLKSDFSEAAQNIKIEFPEVIYVKENNFTLGSVAKISGGSRNTRRILSNLDLYTDGRSLARNEVLRAIQQSEASDARIELYMPSQVKIENPDYEGNFTETETENLNLNNSGYSGNLNNLIPVIKSLSAWNGDVEISGNNNKIPSGKLIDPASIIPGTPAVTLRFRDNSGNLKSMSVRLTWFQNVLIASRNIKKGDKIRNNDFFVRRMKVTRPGVYADKFNNITGFSANKNIKQGEPIMLNSLTSSDIIKKGRRLKVTARYGGATAVTDGVLLEDGRPGEVVKIRRADNKRIILRAKIIDENNAEVEVN